jgi:protein phosphatase
VKITFPELSLVLLIGASGSGKSTFARKHFKETEILSSDHFRGVVSDDESDQSASKDAFEVLHFIAAKRLAAGRLTVIDATNVQPQARKSLLNLAKQYHFFGVAIALNLPESLCHERNKQRPNRQFGPHVVRNQVKDLVRSLHILKKEKIRYVYVLNSLEEIESVEIERQPLWNNQKHQHGPFDIIGDIHGCCDELEMLLQKLGYQTNSDLQENHSPETAFWQFPTYTHPAGRKALFLGDLIDRGPRILDTVKLVYNMVQAGSAMCIVGNHENKLMRKLDGKSVRVSYGLAQTLEEIEAIPDDSRELAKSELQQFLKSLLSHYVLDDGALVIAHAGLREELQGRGSGYVRSFAMYGETTGETDEFGLPVRYDWAAEYRGKAAVVYGHTPVLAAQWVNNTIDIDTGCVYGGKLTALRYPERDLVSVAAARVYIESKKPLDYDASHKLSVGSLAGDSDASSGSLSAQQQSDELLNISDVLGKRIISTRLYSKISVAEENAIAALEVMSRFAANPKWLIYLPPTMSPTATSTLPGLLEHPAEAFAYYQQQGIRSVLCEEKHMGSRVVVIVCRNESVVKKRFGIEDGSLGICYTRTGRRFFTEPALEVECLTRLNQALTSTNFWTAHSTDWVCLDAELMPWSAKAQGLIMQQYAPVGAAATHGLGAAVDCLKQASKVSTEVSTEVSAEVAVLLARYQQRAELAHRYQNAYRPYCWPVTSLADLKLAPFHLLATEGQVHSNKSHDWHLQQIAQFTQADAELLLATQHKMIDVTDEASCTAGTRWWEDLTAAGGEGMVVKSLDFIHRGPKGFAQPAVKCRGAEYLRIIYGPEYTLSENLERLRKRGLGRKRSLALREFALGIESLERFVAKAPLRQVHECVFGILALESEPVDSRL